MKKGRYFLAKGVRTFSWTIYAASPRLLRYLSFAARILEKLENNVFVNMKRKPKVIPLPKPNSSAVRLKVTSIPSGGVNSNPGNTAIM